MMVQEEKMNEIVSMKLAVLMMKPREDDFHLVGTLCNCHTVYSTRSMGLCPRTGMCVFAGVHELSLFGLSWATYL